MAKRDAEWDVPEWHAPRALPNRRKGAGACPVSCSGTGTQVSLYARRSLIPKLKIAEPIAIERMV